jgi:XRE family transcriptional regulator, aerobic/anaerobic benzoate catabolism transcriptional regulator
VSPRSKLQTGDAVFLQALGVRLRLLRARRGMTRRILAQQSGVSERYISAMEGGTGNGSILLLRAIAGALNLPLGALLEDASDSPAQPLPRAPGYQQRIALIGLRGAGKSTLGAALAAQLEVPFIELDRLVEREAGMQLGEILELHGQAGFRRLERSVLDQTIAAHPSAVLAAGGGIVSEPDTFDTLLTHCLTIWLRASPEEHMQRVIDQGDLRPMRDNRQAMADLRAILASREALYARADLVVDTSGQDVQASLRALAGYCVRG